MTEETWEERMLVTWKEQLERHLKHVEYCKQKIRNYEELIQSYTEKANKNE